ncbi:hypothetical protein BV20DRAFT_960726 [Pilatotrama ljubarskyi]|nr:hypothetical protein BV20DRAFT_960726 [Pilatotrama ljubarskyi]
MGCAGRDATRRDTSNHCLTVSAALGDAAGVALGALCLAPGQFGLLGTDMFERHKALPEY